MTHVHLNVHTHIHVAIQRDRLRGECRVQLLDSSAIICAARESARFFPSDAQHAQNTHTYNLSKVKIDLKHTDAKAAQK